MNSTGRYILAICRSANKVIVSNDYGATWASKTTAHGLPATFVVVGCACSAVGYIMYIAFFNGAIMKSTNYGGNWANTSSNASNIYGGML